MNWETRIATAAYTSPRGTRIEFQYENVRVSTSMKTTVFNFPDVDGSFIQDFGREGRRLPIVAYFSGDDYDLLATQFETLLYERGRGRLAHPLYGDFPVVVVGSVDRSDELVTAANQAAVRVTFFETLELVYPQSVEDLQSAAVLSVAASNTAAAGQFADQISLDSVIEQSEFLSAYTDTLDVIGDTLDVTSAAFDALEQSILSGIDTLIGQPIALALQTAQLIQAPANAFESIGASLESYGNLIQEIIGSGDDDDSELVTDDLVVGSSVTASVLAVAQHEYTTQTDAIESAEALLGQFESWVDWRESAYNRVPSLVDTGESYQGVQEAVTVAANYLIDISFTLLQERRRVLDRERTIIDLCAEIYGRVDDNTLNFLINTNQLTGDQILELPRGRVIVYYV